MLRKFGAKFNAFCTTVRTVSGTVADLVMLLGMVAAIEGYLLMLWRRKQSRSRRSLKVINKYSS